MFSFLWVEKDSIVKCSVIDNLLFRFLWGDIDSIVMFSNRQSTVQFSMGGQRQYSYVQYQTVYCSVFYGRIQIDSIVMFSIRQSTVQFSMEGQRQYSYIHYQTIYCSCFYGRIEIVQLCSVSDSLLFRFLWKDRDSIVIFLIRKSSVQVSMEGRRWRRQLGGSACSKIL